MSLFATHIWATQVVLKLVIYISSYNNLSSCAGVWFVVSVFPRALNIFITKVIGDCAQA